MTTIGIANAPASRHGSLVQGFIQALQRWSMRTGAEWKPLLLDLGAAEEMGVSPAEVERRLREPAWRHTGRLL